MDPIKAWERFIAQEKLTAKKLLLLVSGGVDSMTLLSVAASNFPRKNLLVAHFHHNAQAQADAQWECVEKKCAELKVRFEGQRFPPPPEKNQESFWRTHRLKAAQDLAKTHQAGRIITAHHSTDLCETLLFRFWKGCGVGGLDPMDRTSKPFFSCAKDDLIHYAQTHQLTWVEDPTNQELIHDRNKLRPLLTTLREITPQLEKVALNQADYFRDLDLFWDEYFSAEKYQLPICLSDFRDWNQAVKTEFLYRIARPQVSRKEVLDSLRWLENTTQGGSQKTLGSVTLELQQGKLCIKDSQN